MNYFEPLNKIINNATILCVPIVSSINRETNLYRLDCDGNINRIITVFSHVDSFLKLTIVLPSNYESNIIINKFKKHHSNVELVYISDFGKHAGEQRSNPDCFESIYRLIELNYSGVDYIFFESQYLGLELIKNGYSDKLIFYNNVCSIILNGQTKSRSFTIGYEDINKLLIQQSKYTIVVSPETYDYCVKICKDKGVLYIPQLIDRDLKYFDYIKDNMIFDTINYVKSKIFYLPFRLTDEGYQIEKVIEYINKENKESLVLYSDPNNSRYFDKIKLKLNKNIDFIQVSTSRDTFYTILDHPNYVIIPYFEDIAFINHALIHEMFNKKATCRIVLDSSQTIDKIQKYGEIPVNRISWF